MRRDLQQAIEKGTAYIKQHGRPVDRALYAFENEGGSVDVVTIELEKFQNRDGGFGHGYEPDLQCPDSSALCTTEALQTCWKLGLDAKHPLVTGAVQYLLNTYFAEEKGWHFIPESSQDYPHAPWWQFNPDPSATKHNPRPEILGHLWHSRVIVPADLLEELAASVLTDFQADAEDLVMHDLYCYLRLFRTPALREDIKEALLKHLPTMITKNVATTEEAWSGYAARPYTVTQDRNDLFYPLVAESMPHALEYLVNEQMEDGSWPLTWNWGGAYPDAWIQAEKDWKSRSTLENIHLLKHLGAVLLT